MARLFLVAGDDARCVRFCWWVTLSTVTFVGLDRPFLPDDSFSRRPPSRIPNQQGTSLGLPRGSASTSHPLCFRGGISSAPSFPRRAPPGSQMGSCLPSFGLCCGVEQRSRSPSGGTTSSSRSPSRGGVSTLLPAMPCAQGTQTRRAWQPWLSQPCQQARRQRFPRPGLVQRP